MKRRGLALLIFFYGVLPLVQAVYYIGLVASQSLDGNIDWLFSANYFVSIVSYHWMLANVLLSLKIPVLQNWLPYDFRIRLHILSAMVVTVFLLWHAIHTITLNFGGVDFFSWALIPLFFGMVMLSALWIPLPGLKALVVGKAYEFFKGTHKVLFLVVALVSWWHVSEKLEILDPSQSPDLASWSAWGYQVLFYATVGAYLYSRVRDWFFLPQLEVLSVVQVGGITRLTLSAPPRLKYQAGQFAFLRFLVPGMRKEEHPFSFTTVPGEATVGFAIRELGDFTRKVGELKPGDRVKVNAGFGSFSPRYRGTPGRPLALIGSGIGSAPLLGILKGLARSEPNREVVFFQACNQREELIEPEVVAELQTTMPNLRVKTLVYAEDALWYDEALFRRELPDASSYQVFLCSSPLVRSAVVPALQALGVKKDQIVFEAFQLG